MAHRPARACACSWPRTPASAGRAGPGSGAETSGSSETGLPPARHGGSRHPAETCHTGAVWWQETQHAGTHCPRAGAAARHPQFADDLPPSTRRCPAAGAGLPSIHPPIHPATPPPTHPRAGQASVRTRLGPDCWAHVPRPERRSRPTKGERPNGGLLSAAIQPATTMPQHPPVSGPTPPHRAPSPSPTASSRPASTLFPDSSDMSSVRPPVPPSASRPRGRRPAPESAPVLPAPQLRPDSRGGSPPSGASASDGRRKTALPNARMAPAPAPARPAQAPAQSRPDCARVAPATAARAPVWTHTALKPSSVSPVRRPVPLHSPPASPSRSDMSSTRGHVGIEGEEGTFQGTHDVRLVSSSFMAAPPPEPEPVPKAAPVPVPAFRFASPMQRPAPSTPPPGRHPQGLALGYSPDRPLYSSPEGGDGRDSWEQPLLSSPERKAHRSQHSTVGHVPASNQYNDIPDTAARRSPSPKKNVQRKPPSRFVGSSLPFSRTGAHWRPTHQAYGSNISIPDVIGSDDPLAIERRLNAAAATVMVGTGTAHDASQKDLTGDASINPKHHVTMMAQQPTHETLVDQPVGSQTSANSQHHPKSVAIGTDPPTEKEAASRSHTKATLLPTDVDEDPDGYLHAVEKTADRNHGLSCQGVLNMATVVLLAALLVLLFAGYPLMDHFLSKQIDWSRFGLGAGGTNGSGQIPAGLVRTLVDSDTPQSALQWKNNAGSRFDLVFSDEFNVDGRTFYPGDDVRIRTLCTHNSVFVCTVVLIADLQDKFRYIHLVYALFCSRLQSLSGKHPQSGTVRQETTSGIPPKV